MNFSKAYLSLYRVGLRTYSNKCSIRPIPKIQNKCFKIPDIGLLDDCHLKNRRLNFKRRHCAESESCPFVSLWCSRPQSDSPPQASDPRAFGL